MSGIAGIFRRDGGPVSTEDIYLMTQIMAHRGSDGINHEVHGSIALGQCLIHTTPQSLDAPLPLSSQDGDVTIIMDGRADNFEDLRRRILDASGDLRSHADAELVLQAYRLWGEACFKYIAGEFSIAIWDQKKQQLICARDRTGKKPFYYYQDDTYFAFASEMAALLALPWITTSHNIGYLSERLMGRHVTLCDTPWKNIQRLMQGHFMAITIQRSKTERYWYPENLPPLIYKKQSDYVEHYRDLFLDNIRRYSRSLKPLGFEVSGGLDSTALFAAASKLEDDGCSLAPSLNGYSLDFGDHLIANDMPYVRVAQDFIDRVITPINPDYSTPEINDKFVSQHKTFPVAPNGYMHGQIYKSMKSVDQRSLITGLGGDEWLFGGRNVYADFLSYGDWHGLMDYLALDIEHQGFLRTGYQLFRRGLVYLIPLSILRLFDPQPPAISVSLPDSVQRLYRLQKRQARIEVSDTIRDKKKMGTLFNADIRFGNETMEHFAASEGIELRAPYESQAMIEFGLSVPQGRKNRRDKDRDLHRKAMTDILPAEIIERDNKAEFSLTFKHTLSSLVTNVEWMDVLTEGGWLGETQRDSLYTRMKAAPTDNDYYTLWALYTVMKFL